MVAWSDEAKADLRNIFNYIASDSRYYAHKIVDEIIAKADILNELPRIGRVVPEIGDSDVREIPVYSYRIIYEISGNNISILAVAHKRRNLKAEEIRKPT